MKPLPTQLQHSGYTLTQIERTLTTAIYRKAKPGYHNEHYEAIVIQIAPARTFPDGKSVEERECFHSSEQWGTYGWSMASLDDARNRLALVCPKP